MEYFNSFENLKQLSTNNDTMTKMNTNFYIIMVTVIISMDLLIVVNLYIKVKNEHGKIKNSIEETIINKI